MARVTVKDLQGQLADLRELLAEREGHGSPALNGEDDDGRTVKDGRFVTGDEYNGFPNNAQKVHFIDADSMVEATECAVYATPPFAGGRKDAVADVRIWRWNDDASEWRPDGRQGIRFGSDEVLRAFVALLV